MNGLGSADPPVGRQQTQQLNERRRQKEAESKETPTTKITSMLYYVNVVRS